MSEPHEIRGPYTAYVVATKRKDGRCPDLSKVLSDKNGACPMMFFDYLDEALEVAAQQNREFHLLCPKIDLDPYGAFEVLVTFVQEHQRGEEKRD